MTDLLAQPWPWFVAGPLIGLIVPLLLLIDGKPFGISENLRHICAATVPGRLDLFRYDWRRGLWNLTLVAGVAAGGFIAATWLASPDPSIAISEATKADLGALGLSDLSGLVPREVFSWSRLATIPGFILVVVGGFFVGFGARYAAAAPPGMRSRDWPTCSCHR